MVNYEGLVRDPLLKMGIIILLVTSQHPGGHTQDISHVSEVSHAEIWAPKIYGGFPI